jgi:putative addiction module component (TIGR02574 family)
MTPRDAVLKQALALPPEERAYVADVIEHSLAPAGAVTGEELLAELKRRSAAYQSGSMSAKPAAEVIAELRRRQSGGS